VNFYRDFKHECIIMIVSFSYYILTSFWIRFRDKNEYPIIDILGSLFLSVN